MGKIKISDPTAVLEVILDNKTKNSSNIKNCNKRFSFSIFSFCGLWRIKFEVYLNSLWSMGCVHSQNYEKILKESTYCNVSCSNLNAAPQIVIFLNYSQTFYFCFTYHKKNLKRNKGWRLVKGGHISYMRTYFLGRLVKGPVQ